MKILFLVHNRNNPNAGAARIYHMLTDALVARGHDVDALYMGDFGLPRSRLGSIVAQRVAMPWLVSRGGARQGAAGYDVVMASNGMASPLFRRLRRAPRRPVLVNHVHGFSVYDHMANLAEATLGRRRVSLPYRLVTGPGQVRWDAAGVASADVSVVQNLRDLSMLTDGGEDPSRVVMIPGALHPDILAGSATATPIEERDPNALLWFATWEARKGCSYLPAAFRRIREARPAARLTMGGTGKAPGELKALFDPRDRDHVEVAPFLSVAEHAALMNRSSVFLFPSLSEGYGLALLEALSFGLAAVTTNTGFGGDFLRDGESARIVFPSSGHVARAVLDILEDPALRSRLSRNGRGVAKDFTPDHQADAYETLFRERTAVRG
jgi:glycosyltransferase involved in cell wall biosynthesis